MNEISCDKWLFTEVVQKNYAHLFTIDSLIIFKLQNLSLKQISFCVAFRSNITTIYNIIKNNYIQKIVGIIRYII